MRCVLLAFSAATCEVGLRCVGCAFLALTFEVDLRCVVCVSLAPTLEVNDFDMILAPRYAAIVAVRSNLTTHITRYRISSMASTARATKLVIQGVAAPMSLKRQMAP